MKKEKYSREQLDAAKKMGVNLPKEAKKANANHDPNFNDKTSATQNNGPMDQGMRMRNASSDARAERKEKETPKKKMPTGTEAYENKNFKSSK